MTLATPPTPSSQLELPLHVHSLRIFGTSATRSSFLRSATLGIFEAQKASDVLAGIKEMTAKLQCHDIFDDINVYVDSEDQTSSDAVNVVLNVKEKQLGRVNTSIYAGENEPRINSTLALRNALGGAETVSVQSSIGYYTKTAFEASVGTPIRGSPDAHVDLFAGGWNKDWSLINYYKETATTAGVRFKGTSRYGDHQIKYALTRRETTALPDASAAVLSEAGQRAKSSVYHSFVRDRRDHPTAPTCGHFISFYQELAGVGNRGEAHFLKQQFVAQHHHTLAEGRDGGRLVFSSGVHLGFLKSLGDKPDVHFSDRLYLGGPLSVRGFKTGGIGPRDGNDAIGGEASWAAGASLTGSVPGSPNLPVKLHAFFNAGNTVGVCSGKEPATVVQELSEDPRTSAGVGLVISHRHARLEVNYCIPLRYRTGDVPTPGIQLGLGMHFL